MQVGEYGSVREQGEAVWADLQRSECPTDGSDWSVSL